MINDISVISKELNQLGYTTSLVNYNDGSILLFYRDSTKAEIIFGISQLKATRDISLGNIMLAFDGSPTLVYNSILKEITYSFDELLEKVKAIECGVDENYSKDYISKEMLLDEKFESPREIIQRFIAINNYTP